MIGYCATTHCLRGYILEYFGQEHPDTCHNCGNCQGSFTERNVTEKARVILEGVEEIERYLGYYLGESLVVKQLRGSKIKRLQQLEGLSCRGRLRSLSEETVSGIISELKERKLLWTNHDYETLERTEQELSEDEVVLLRQRGREEPERPVRQTVDSGRMEQLKALRMKLAQAERVPAYIVFSNATLEDMARREPRTMEEFLEVSGVGARKAEKYGEAFLELFRG